MKKDLIDALTAQPVQDANGGPGKGGPPACIPVVGIGASAGGLKALTTFLEHIPPDTGLAFVVIQHLDPTHESILASLFARSTRMPVAQVTDGLAVERNHVYVVPPNSVMRIENSVL